ncbi:hypothetical protein AAFF_G00136510 [Aldrovandia affinis]|uniref:Uncharacterized protein n=1 Tax=Aldrovandia affinis TaxID=143900 RepID=A0AAD7W9B0_9TELE|nr:hypothetical protein AAFF_G00136510 [Aldrovandia affinis]
MPLADFYTTHPFHNKLAFDYWIRLNKAIDMAEDVLKRQGKTLENLAREVTVMFIRHCPDPELALVFKCKPLEEWTAGEVHLATGLQCVQCLPHQAQNLLSQAGTVLVGRKTRQPT